MFTYSSQVAERRKSLKLSQTELSILAHTSLPTIQNIEAGKANPSWDIVSNIFAVLGFELDLRPRLANWDILEEAGVPLLGKSLRASEHTDFKRVFRELVLAGDEISNSACDPRKKEALQAYLLALKIHYPSTFRRVIKVESLSQIFPTVITGRLVKLSRIARASISKYL